MASCVEVLMKRGLVTLLLVAASWLAAMPAKAGPWRTGAVTGLNVALRYVELPLLLKVVRPDK
jgi:hypothetical protein